MRIKQHLDKVNAAAIEALKVRQEERAVLTRVRLELESLRILLQRVNKREKLKRDGMPNGWRFYLSISSSSTKIQTTVLGWGMSHSQMQYETLSRSLLCNLPLVTSPLEASSGVLSTLPDSAWHDRDCLVLKWLMKCMRMRVMCL